MTTKNVMIFRYITIISIILFVTTACETDFDNTGGVLVDNNVFGADKIDFELTAYNKNLSSSRVDNISTGLSELLMPLGVMQSDDFGVLTSSFIAQLTPPATVDWENTTENPVILDAVYLEIPYEAKDIRVASDDATPRFELENVFGNKDAAYVLKVYRLNTFLSSLDPTDPSKAKKYYSDKIFNKGELLYSNANDETKFTPNENDTVLKYQRTLIKQVGGNIENEEVVKLTDVKPFIKIPLDKSFFEDNFINGTDISFDNTTSFQETFNGIIIEATGIDGSVMMLNFPKAKINLYLSSGTETEEKTEFELNVDLNDDDIIDGEDVTTKHEVRKKTVVSFPLLGIKTNHIERDYSASNASTSLNSPNTTDGEKKLFVQGAAGSVAIIDLFKNIDLTEYRNKNWLINEASLTFYIDNENDNEIPNRVLLYKIDPDFTNDINENEQILDAIKESNLFNGYLQKDGDVDDDDRNPIKYKVNITEYITQILKKEDFTEPSQLALKIFNSLDAPTDIEDTVVEEYSWSPKGVVLYGNNYISTDADYDKRVRLEVYYTELKN